jgi:predicted transcriptional regulator of viral defense system
MIGLVQLSLRRMSKRSPDKCRLGPQPAPQCDYTRDRFPIGPGLFVLVPPELGSATEFSGNPYLTSRALAGGHDYYISYASAMELHRMVTQPQFVVFTSTARRLRNKMISGTEFRFVNQAPDSFFGITSHWVTKQEAVRISDPERTIIDGLKHPEYRGRDTEVGKGLWIRRADLRPTLLVELRGSAQRG